MNGRNRRILYMEHDRAVASLVRRQLERLGYVVDVACDGHEGLTKYTSGCYDAVAVNQIMPGPNGLDVIRTLASQGPLPPTIMVADVGNEAIAAEALKLGVSDYLVKDMAGGFLHFLPAVIERAIEHRQLADEKRRAEEEVRALKQQIEFVLRAAKTGLHILGPDYHLRYVDPKWQEVYGDPAGRTCYEYFMGQTERCEKCRMEKVLQTKQIAVTEGFLPKEKNRPAQITSIPFRDQHGEWLVAEVTVDISAQKRMERELAGAQKMEAIGRLAAGIAHEINTPMQYIGDNSRFLQEGFDDLGKLLGTFGRLLQAAKDETVTDELISEIETQIRGADVGYLTAEIPVAIRQSLEGVDRVATIIQAMKEFSHPGEQKKQAVDLNHAIKNALAVSRNEWKHVAEVLTDFDPSLPAVYCLPGDLNQAVLNLIVNAAYAIAEVAGEGAGGKGLITIRTRREGDWVEIRMEDTGTGIPEEIRSKVFDPFFTTKEVGKGSGQGLAIVHAIVVEKHGGTISFETQTGRGTTFIIRLPISGQPAKSKDTKPIETESAY